MALDRTLDIVSIHASVKDATMSRQKINQSPKVSIHASVKDATIEVANDTLAL